jgi:hypothetical protein
VSAPIQFATSDRSYRCAAQPKISPRVYVRDLNNQNQAQNSHLKPGDKALLTTTLLAVWWSIWIRRCRSSKRATQDYQYF